MSEYDQPIAVQSGATEQDVPVILALLKDGKAAYKLQDYARATDIFLSVVGSGVDDPTCHLHLARIYNLKRDWQSALPHWSWLRDKDPELIEPQLQVARAYFRLDQQEIAIAEFDKVLRLAPDHVEAKRSLRAVRSAKRTDDLADADSNLQGASEEAPGNVELDATDHAAGAVQYSESAGRIDSLDGPFVIGWAVHAGSPNKAVNVEVLVDAEVVCRATANRRRGDLALIGIGGYGFRARLPAIVFDGKAHRLSARIADSGELLEGFFAGPIRLMPDDALRQDHTVFISPDYRSAFAEILAKVTVDVIVCVHNAFDDTRRCLDTLIEKTSRPFSLFVVDDGSDPETEQFLRRLCGKLPDATYLRHEISRGYTVAANRGLRAGDGDYAVLLNSDTIVTAGWLDRLLACALADPRAAMIGPLSNAASWQSIPQLKGPDGRWLVNELPADVTLDAIGDAIGSTTAPLYPQVPLVNGFCYMIPRAVLSKVGYLDEKRFPRGYGEEDDFSLRAASLGYHGTIADDCYVYHAKSKSFTPATRLQITRGSKDTLKQRHGSAVNAAVAEMQYNEDLLRARVRATIALEHTARHFVPPDYRDNSLAIGWIQPHLEVAGGIRRSIEMTNRMAAWGTRPIIITPQGKPATWLPMQAAVISVNDARDRMFDILICSDPDTVEIFETLLARRKVIYHLAAYMLYRDKNDLLTRYYKPVDGMVHLTNSNWTKDRVEEAFPALRVHEVIPGGIAHDLFYPVPMGRDHDVGFFGSIRRKHKGTPTILEATVGLRRMSLTENNPLQSEMAAWISRCRSFASGAWHEGFNFPPLEAMACGVPVVMTDDGGSRDYARDGENALVVPIKDAKAMRRAIERVLVDQDLRLALIEAGMNTAKKYDWDDLTASFGNILYSAI